MAKLIEIPSIALRDRLFPARTRKIDQHPVTEADDARNITIGQASAMSENAPT